MQINTNYNSSAAATIPSVSCAPGAGLDVILFILTRTLQPLGVIVPIIFLAGEETKVQRSSTP